MTIFWEVLRFVERFIKFHLSCWYAANMLKLNDDKTEMLVIGSKYRTIPKLPDLNVGSTVITPGEHVRNLGVIMDTKFTMEPHITKIMQIAFLKTRQISYYRKFLTPSAAKTLIHAYITSRLDYCNGLLYGLPTNLVAKLQSIYQSSTGFNLNYCCSYTSPYMAWLQATYQTNCH